MTLKNEWITTSIRELIAKSMPGEWGEDGVAGIDIPVLRSTNFCNDGKIDYSDVVYRKIEKSKLLDRLVNCGTILIEKSGGSPSQPAGRIVYCDRDFNGTVSNFIEIVKVKEEFHPKFVAYLLYYLYKTGVVLKYQQQTTGIINFKLNEYIEERISLPLLRNEQSKITEILESVDHSIEMTKSLIAKHEKIKIGLMEDLLTKGIDKNGKIRSEKTHEFKDSPLGRIPAEWNILQLGKILENINQGWSPDCESRSAGFGEWGVLKTTAVVWQGYFDNENKALPEKLKPKHSLEIRTGDLLMTRAGPNSRVGVVAYVYKTREKLMLSDKIYRLIPSKEMDGRFLCYSLSGFQSQRYLSSLKTGMAESQTNISQEIVKSLLTVMPEKNEQIKIADLLDFMGSEIRQNVLSLEKLYVLKTALMQDLLTGKKRVTTLLSEAEVINQ